MSAASRMTAGLVLFILLSSAMLSGTALDIGKKRVVVKRFSMCSNSEKLPMQWYDMEVKHDRQDTIINCKMRNEKPIQKLIVKLNFLKCDDSGNPDSCEYAIKDFTSDKICEFMYKEDELWTVFVQRIDRNVSCPIQPGEYNIREVPVKSDFLKYLPISDAVWKVKLEGFDENNVKISCINFDIQITKFVNTRIRS